MKLSPIFAAFFVATALTAMAQDVAPTFQSKTATLRDGRKIDYAVLLPKGFERDRPTPVVFFLSADDPESSSIADASAQKGIRTLHAAGFLVVQASIKRKDGSKTTPREVAGVVLRETRLMSRPEGLRIHLIDRSGTGLALALDAYAEFETVSLLDVPVVPKLFAKRPERTRHVRFAATAKVWESAAVREAFGGEGGGESRVLLLGTPDRPGTAEEFVVSARRKNGPGTDISAASDALDDFHDAAAKADGARYFGLFTPNGVFLGTDGTERWTVDEFKKWSEPYFKEPPGWIFVPLDRRLTVEDDGKTAFFDETPWSTAYGPCRGTGLLRKSADGRWRIAQYDLTIPIPNDLADDVVKVIDQFPFGKRKTVYLVRHAEKGGEKTDKDPELSEAGTRRAEDLARTLRDAAIGSIFVSEYKRTMATVRPLAGEQKLEPKVIPAAETATLIDAIKEAEGNVLVAGHSNTLAPILSAFGIADAEDLGEFEFDTLFVLELSPGKSSLTKIHYGPKNPLPMPKR